MGSIQFHHYLELPKQMRRDVAGFMLSCSKRVLLEVAGKGHAAELAHVNPINLAVSFIRLVEMGLAEIVVESTEKVFLRHTKGVKVVGIYGVH
jgi:hypothetical protein